MSFSLSDTPPVPPCFPKDASTRPAEVPCHLSATGVPPLPLPRHPPPAAARALSLSHTLSPSPATLQRPRSANLPSPSSQIGSGCWRRGGIDNGVGSSSGGCCKESHFHTFLAPAPPPPCRSHFLDVYVRAAGEAGHRRPWLAPPCRGKVQSGLNHSVSKSLKQFRVTKR